MSQYHIKVLQPRPSMNHDKRMFTGTYQEAVDETHRIFLETGRSASLYSDEFGMTCWHYICAYTKKAEDNNFNSGVVFTEQY